MNVLLVWNSEEEAAEKDDSSSPLTIVFAARSFVVYYTTGYIVMQLLNFVALLPEGNKSGIESSSTICYTASEVDYI
jgi:hypothetical protein